MPALHEMPAFHLVARQGVAKPPPVAVADPNANYGPSILAITGVFCFAACATVLLRLYVRVVMLKSLGWDDWMMLAAQTMSIATFACFIAEVQNGVGRHTATLTLSQFTEIEHWSYFHSLLVMVGISLVKISISFFLLRFMPGKKQKYFIIGCIIFLVAFTISCAGTLIWNCIPIQASWDHTITNAKCFSLKTFADIGMFNSSINIATDVLFAALPIPIIWGLKTNLRTKITLSAIVSLGLFACISSIVKTVYQSNVLENPDFYFHYSFFVWNFVELNIGILAASLPTLRPLFAKALGNMSSRAGNSGARIPASGGRYDRDGLSYGRNTKNTMAKKGYQEFDTERTQNSAMDVDMDELSSKPNRHFSKRDIQEYDRRVHGSALKTGYVSTTVSAMGDNESDEIALTGNDGGGRAGEITKTTQVTVTRY